MTELVLHLPEDVVQRASSAGLLSNHAIQELLEDAMRREAGRKLVAIAKDIHAANIAPMSEDELMEEIYAVRRERRAAQNNNPAQH